MKKANITIQYDEEKLETLNVYLNDKRIDLNEEVGKMLDSLYNKHVPQAVRDFFGKKSGSITDKKPSPNARSRATKNAPCGEPESRI